MKIIKSLFFLLAMTAGAAEMSDIASLPLYDKSQAQPADWFLKPSDFPAQIFRNEKDNEIILTNGLVRRVFRISPNAATVSLDDLTNDRSLLRSVRPEAMLTIDGQDYQVGGLKGQKNHAFLSAKALNKLESDPSAFQFHGFSISRNKKRFEWKRKGQMAQEATWPVLGIELVLHFRAPDSLKKNIRVDIHHVIYDGMPLLSKWLVVHNNSKSLIKLNSYINEELAIVENESHEEGHSNNDPEDNQYSGHFRHPQSIEVLSTVMNGGFTPSRSNITTHWLADPLYKSQVNFRLKNPCLLQCRLAIGPSAKIEVGTAHTSFRNFIIVHDSSERLRRSLTLKRLMRNLAPWICESPLYMQVKSAKPEVVRKAIDQASDCGYEGVIMSFFSGFNIENDDPAYIAKYKELADYAHSKDIEIGCYAWLGSRTLGKKHDVVNIHTGKIGGHGRFGGRSPCLESEWGQDYFRKLKNFFAKTGFDLLDHRGSYGGHHCASESHPGHDHYDDSHWSQYSRIAGFYQWCRGRGISLNVPDFFFLMGSNRCGIGYRESNRNFRGEEYLVLARQNIHDGSWSKSPSMAWMVWPKSIYKESDKVFEQIQALTFGSGIHICYPEYPLFHSENQKAIVQKWTKWYKENRHSADADIIPIRRADGRDADAFLHINPESENKALICIFNPLEKALQKTFTVPLYYTGLSGKAVLVMPDGHEKTVSLDEKSSFELTLTIPASGQCFIRVKE